MYRRIYAHTHIHSQAPTHTQTHAHMHTHSNVQTHVQTHAHTRSHTHTQTNTCSQPQTNAIRQPHMRSLDLGDVCNNRNERFSMFFSKPIIETNDF